MNSENLLEPLGKFQQNLAKNGIPDKTHPILVIRLCIHSLFPPYMSLFCIFVFENVYYGVSLGLRCLYMLKFLLFDGFETYIYFVL